MTSLPPGPYVIAQRLIHRQEPPWTTRPNGLVDGTNRDLDAFAISDYIGAAK